MMDSKEKRMLKYANEPTKLGTTIEQKNKEVAEWLGICSHDWIPSAYTNQEWMCRECKQIHSSPLPSLPDFSQGAGIIRLLEEMMKREDYAQFSVNHNFIPYDLEFSNHPFIQLCHCKWAIPSDYITTPGKLLDAVWEWLRKEAK